MKHGRQRTKAGRHGDQERAAVVLPGTRVQGSAFDVEESASVLPFRRTYIDSGVGGGVPIRSDPSARTIHIDGLVGVGSKEQQAVCGDGVRALQMCRCVLLKAVRAHTWVGRKSVEVV